MNAKATVSFDANNNYWVCRLDDMPTMWEIGQTAEEALSNFKANYLEFLATYGVYDIVT